MFSRSSYDLITNTKLSQEGIKIIVFYFFISENLNEAFSHFIAGWNQVFATE
jgi:hypothetical protein